MKTRILLVDDSERWRLSVRLILERTAWFQVVGEASDGVEAVTQATALLPDVVVLDIGMPRLNGIEAAKKIRQACPESKIIFLSQEDDGDVRKAALGTGGLAYLLKSHANHELKTTIQTAMLTVLQTARAMLLVSGESSSV